MFNIMTVFRISVFLLGLFAFCTAQDVGKKKGCDCKCKRGDTLLSSIVNPKFENEKKSGCNICEQRKEMLRKEKEKELQFQKCPFEILGSPAMKEKTSEEIFDNFRELLVPSQNGFFDLLRGVVKTMHVSSESELKWAQEKEAKLVAQKRLMEKQRKIEEETERKMEEEEKETEVVQQELKVDVGGKDGKSYRGGKSPFYKAFFRKGTFVKQPHPTHLEHESYPHSCEQVDLQNLQNLEPEEISLQIPNSFTENTESRPPSITSKQLTELNLLGLSPSCKKEEEFFNFEPASDKS